MKVFTILYQSKLYPERVAMSSAPELNLEDAIKNGIERLNREQGEYDWKDNMVNVLEIKLPDPDEVKASQNWVLNKIIINKDLNLHKAMLKYMTLYEKQYIADKLKVNNNKII